MTRKQESILCWIIFLSIAGPLAFYEISSSREEDRERATQKQSAAILERVIKADPRFSKLRMLTPYGRPFTPYVTGQVRSVDELRELKKLISNTLLPREPNISVTVESKPDEQPH